MQVTCSGQKDNVSSLPVIWRQWRGPCKHCVTIDRQSPPSQTFIPIVCCALSIVPRSPCLQPPTQVSEPRCGMTAEILAVKYCIFQAKCRPRHSQGCAPELCTINSRLSTVPVKDDTIMIIEELGLATLSAHSRDHL